jgi:hypothetical protein
VFIRGLWSSEAWVHPWLWLVGQGPEGVAEVGFGNPQQLLHLLLDFFRLADMTKTALHVEQLQNIPIGSSILVASCPLYDDPSGQPQYRHGFYRDCGTGLGPEGSRLVVTRTASNEWTVEAESDASARVFSATTKGRAQVVDYGLLSLPFKMTLTAK